MNARFVMTCAFLLMFGGLLISVLDGLAPAEGGSRIGGYVLDDAPLKVAPRVRKEYQTPSGLLCNRLYHIDNPMHSCRTYHVEVCSAGVFPPDKKLKELCKHLWRENDSWRGFTVQVHLPGTHEAYVAAHFSPSGMWLFEKYSDLTRESYRKLWNDVRSVPENTRQQVYADFATKRDVAPDDASHVAYSCYEVARDYGLDESLVWCIASEGFWKEW